MPEISRFFGIVITMYADDHGPPHFHARHGESKARIAIADYEILAGSLPPRALGMVIEWATIHRAELEHDWRLASGRPNPWVADPGAHLRGDPAGRLIEGPRSR